MAKVSYIAKASVVGGHGASACGELAVDLRHPPETGGRGGGTNPEELFAIGYAACPEGAHAVRPCSNATRGNIDVGLSADGVAL